MKQAKDFLVDTQLGEKKFEISELKNAGDDKIVLTIEEGSAMSADLVKEATSGGIRGQKKKSFFVRLDESLKSIGKPQPKDIATFFRLLSIMINAGIPLVRSLDTIGDQTVNLKLKNAIVDMARSIERGSTFSESMAGYTNIFNEGHLGMIRSGEISGQLNQTLKQLAIEVEKSSSIIRKVKGAMMYPAFIVVVMILVIIAMMVFVVPKIAAIFSEGGRELPFLTMVVIGISDFLVAYWLYIIGAMIALAFGVIAIGKTKKGRYAFDLLLINIPIFGPLLRKAILSRFCRSLGNLLISGIPIIKGLNINAKGLGNEVYRMRVEMAAEDIAQGIPLGESLRDSPEFPAMMVQMIAVGEQTAQLDNISGKIAEYYEDEVDAAVAGMSKVLEPLILIVVGVVVGGIIAAIMMPILQMSQLTGV